MLDDAAAALHAQLRVVERRLVGGAADAEIERESERGAEAAGVESGRFGAEQVIGRNPAVLERHRAAAAVIPAVHRAVVGHTQSGASRGTRKAVRRHRRSRP